MYAHTSPTATPTKNDNLSLGRKPRTNSETTRTLVSEFEAHLLIYTPTQPPPVWQVTRHFRPLFQCANLHRQCLMLKIQYQTLFGCVESIEWGSDLVPGLLVRLY
jgi:hypothetical protein